MSADSIIGRLFSTWRRSLPALQLVAIGAALFLWLVVALISFHSWDRSNADVHVYWEAGERLRAGGVLYDSSPGKRFIYPPFVATAFAFLSTLSPVSGYAVWMAFHFVLLAIVFVCLARTFRFDASALRRFAALVGVVLFTPVAAELEEGQVNLLVVAPVVGGLLMLERKRDGLAGTLFAVAAHVKAFPVVLLGALWMQGRRRAAAWMAAALIVLVFSPMLVLAPVRGPLDAASEAIRLHATFVTRIAAPALADEEVFGTPEYYSSNYSLLGVANRLFTEGVELDPSFLVATPRTGPLIAALPPPLPNLAAGSVTLALIVLGLWICRRRRGSPSERVTGMYVVLIAANLGNLTFWEHHLVSLVVPLAVLVAQAPSCQRCVSIRWTALVALVMTLTLPKLAALGASMTSGTGGVWLDLSRDFGLPLVGVLLVIWAVSENAYHAAGSAKAEFLHD